MSKQFPVIFLIGRPAAGKSEVIKYLKECSADERLERFHVGEFIEIDDFPMLWTWFEEDELLQRMGKPRLHSTGDGYFNEKHLWNLLIKRIDLDYHKLTGDNPGFSENGTAVLEFARGTEHGGWKEAFTHFSDDLLKMGAALYINVDFSESLRKNRRRFNPSKPHSILEHGLSDEKMERLYKGSDWEEFSSADSEFLDIRGIRVPYAVFENMDDVTTPGGEPLGKRLEQTMDLLWSIKNRG